MSRSFITILIALLSALPFGSHAGVEDDELRLRFLKMERCWGTRYAEKLEELQSRYRECAQRYVELGQNPGFTGSIGACGNYGTYDQQAQDFANNVCKHGGDFIGPPAPPATVFNFGGGEEAAGTTCGLPGLPACTADAKGADPGRENKAAPPAKEGAVPAETPRKAGAEPPKRDTPEEDGTDPSPSPGDRENEVAGGTPTPQEPGAAQYEAQNDINTASNSSGNASRCCNNPQSCTSVLAPSDQQNLSKMMQTAQTAPTSGQGLSEYCAQMKSTTSSGSGINGYMASICSSQKNSCEITCDSLLTKYQALYNSCGNCSSSQIYSSTYNSIKSIRNSCSALAGRASLLAQQGTANANSGGYAQACNNFTGTPQGMDFGTQQDKANDTTSSGNCLTNPNGPGCTQTQLAVKEQTDSAGEAGFGDTKTEKETFNLQDTNDIPGLSAYLPKGIQPQAITNGTIANNSGGGIPGGSASPASLPPKSSSSPGSPGYDTDILKGTSSPSGGGSSGNAQLAGNDPRPMDGRWQPMSNSESSSLVGMDLKQYLPGASLDPHRQIAGISAGSQINRKEENIWRIISNKMYEKCKLGVLWRCGPE